MTDTRTKEAIRYLGYGKNAVDAATMSLISDSFKELDICSDKRSLYRVFDCIHRGDGIIEIGKMEIHSKSLSKNLKGCSRAVAFGASLGVQVDLLMKRYALFDMARVVVLQACAAAMLEEYCDACEEAIMDTLRQEGLWLRPRFSPGYGDFDIHHQKDMIQMLDSAKKIGLTMTESYMLTPTKSVTAIIGLSPVSGQCHRKGCQVCEKKDCDYRRN